MLWESGANTYDVVAQDYFTMRAALVTTMQDYPGCGYISGQVIQDSTHALGAWITQAISN